MLILKYLSKLIKILRKGASPNQIAGGFVLGMIIGLTPVWSLHNLLVLFILLILNVNISVAILSFTIFSGVAYIFDPWFHSLGFYLLVDVKSLHDTWVSLYNVPVIALSRFNNTVVMGSLVVSLLLIVPMFFATRVGVVAYREKVEARLMKWKIVQAVKSSGLYQWYEKIKSIGE